MTFKCHLLGRRRIQFLLSSFLFIMAKNILDIHINIHQIEKIIFIKCNYAWFWFTVVPTVRVNWVLSAWHSVTKVNCYAFNLKEESTLSQKIQQFLWTKHTSVISLISSHLMSNLLVIYTYNMYNVYEIFCMALHNLLWKLTEWLLTSLLTSHLSLL